MFDKIKKGLMLAGYGLGFKSKLLFAVGFMLGGFALEFFDKAGNILGGFYIVLAAMFVLQLVISLNLSTMVQTSPYKRKLETVIPILTSTPLLLFNYTVMVLIRLYYLYLDPAVTADVNRQMQARSGLVAISILLFVTAIYMGVCYKFFWSSFVFLFAVVFPIAFISRADWFAHFVMKLPIGGIVAGGYLMIIIGQTAAYLASVVFYKRELSRHAFSAALKRSFRQ